MILQNKTYDILKNIALILPLINTFIITIMKIWNIPYAAEVALTLAAVNALISGIVKIASSSYKKSKSTKTK